MLSIPFHRNANGSPPLTAVAESARVHHRHLMWKYVNSNYGAQIEGVATECQNERPLRVYFPPVSPFGCVVQRKEKKHRHFPRKQDLRLPRKASALLTGIRLVCGA